MKKLSLCALTALVGSSLALGFAPQLPASAASPASATLVATGTSGSAANSGVGDSGGQAWGVNTTLVGSTRWTVFESSASNLITGDTNGASDIFVTNGSTITRLSVSASGVQGEIGFNSYDPTICASGRKVVFTTENEWDIDFDGNGFEDVYVIDRDADADGVMDEFLEANSVTMKIVSISYTSDTGDYAVSFEGANAGVISDDCTKAAFITNEALDEEDVNFGPDVYVADLVVRQTLLTRATASASSGGDGGGNNPAISGDGAAVVVATEAGDLVSDTGVAGLVLREAGEGRYLTRTPAGVASTGTLADNERPAAITPDGKCVAFKADRGYDLLANSAGPTQGIFLWDNRTGTPVITLVSIAPDGIAATSAANPRISDDCRFVAYQSSDEFLSSADNNRKVDVFLYDTVQRTTDLISTNAAGLSSDGDSSVAALDWDKTSGRGVVMVMSSASNIGGAAGGNSTIDLFSVPFTAEVSTAGGLTALSAPARLLDTRTSGIKVGKTDGTGTAYDLTVAGVSGVPSTGVAAVAMNVTVVDGEAADVGGYVTVYPCGTRPNSSNLNFVNGQTVPNAVIAPLSASGHVCFYVYGKAHLLADVSGYFTAGFTALSAPTRLLDTRGSGNKVGKTDGTGTAYELTVAGSNGLPAAGTLGIVAMNVTVVDGEAADVGGYVTVYPCGTRPNSSNLNFVNGQTVPNAAIASVSAAGKVCFYVYGKAHLLVDVAGYFG